jgi:importin-9
VSATLKILKVLVDELLQASGMARAIDSANAIDVADDASDKDDWEDEPDTFNDLGTGMTKQGIFLHQAVIITNFSIHKNDADIILSYRIDEPR